jgi:hypothetical protein
MELIGTVIVHLETYSVRQKGKSDSSYLVSIIKLGSFDEKVLFRMSPLNSVISLYLILYRL